MKKQNNIKTEYFDGVVRSKQDKRSLVKDTIGSIIKIISVSLLSLFLLLSLSSVGGTVSYYRNIEKSVGNYLRADPISFQVSPASSSLDLSTESKITLDMNPDVFSDPIQYFVSAKQISGDSNFCNAISATGTWPFPVNGYLFNMLTETSTSTGAWTLTLSVPDSFKIGGSECEIELTYFGWLDGVDVGRSFSDMRKVKLTFVIPTNYSPAENFIVSSGDVLVESQDDLTEESKESKIIDKESEDDSVESLEVEESIVLPQKDSVEETLNPLSGEQVDIQ